MDDEQGEPVMYVFSHLHKAAGTTVVHLLRRTFGLRHLDAVPGSGHIYRAEDLKADLFRMVKPVSLASHGLRPYIDYGDMEEQMQWYTIIRDPLRRCISHYQHQVQKMQVETPFLEWMGKNLHRNWMVYFYGGSDSLQQAIDAVHAKNVRVVDIADGLDTQLAKLFPVPLKWKRSVKNPARNNRIRDMIESNPIYMEELHAANALDMQLYQYMKRIQEENSQLIEHSPPLEPLFGTTASFLYRNLVYRALRLPLFRKRVK